ncbi:MAG: hypothetical protein JXJ17_09145 [Anaerolineae bacterium]|nr:hypothetical protein [Anaerolineae bacterium]
MDVQPDKQPDTPLLRWTRHSSVLLGAMTLIIGLVIYIWWPLAEEYLALIDWQGEWWRTFDWLLLGIFAFMSVVLVSGADLKADLPIIGIGLIGGLVIESWGTQTVLWTYYTLERPPLWIIPAWPIASLTIDRLVKLLDGLSGERIGVKGWRAIYIAVFAPFVVLLLVFVWPTIDKSLTVISLILCALLIGTPKGFRTQAITFIAGSGLGYFLELWGTTRQCWTYYTYQTPPLFAVLAHGMAAVAFWRVLALPGMVIKRVREGRKVA